MSDQYTKCVWCWQPLGGENSLTPSKCLQKHKGEPEKQHKIHESCWWGKPGKPGFGAENGKHPCPGCNNKRPVIDLTSSSRSSPGSHTRRRYHSPPRRKPKSKSKSKSDDVVFIKEMKSRPDVIDLTGGRRRRKTRRGRFGRKGKRRM